MYYEKKLMMWASLRYLMTQSANPHKSTLGKSDQTQNMESKPISYVSITLPTLNRELKCKSYFLYDLHKTRELYYFKET